jgi:hypothetical protein
MNSTTTSDSLVGSQRRIRTSLFCSFSVVIHRECTHPRYRPGTIIYLYPTEDLRNTSTLQASTSSFQNASLGAVLNQNESPGPSQRAPVFHAADEQGSDEEAVMEEVPLSDFEDDWEVVRNEGRSERHNPLKLAKKKVEKLRRRLRRWLRKLIKSSRGRGNEGRRRIRGGKGMRNGRGRG